jgi:integrase
MSQKRRRGRTEGAIYQRADGQWVASLSLGYDGSGKRKRRVVYGATKQEVQEKLRQLQHDASTGKLADAGSITVQEWLTTWLDMAKTRVQPKTHLRYEQIVRLRVSPHLGGTRLAKLAPVHVQQLFAALERAGVSPRGRQMAGTLLHKALRDAVRLRLITTNPAAEVEKPKPGKPKMQVYDEEQARALLAAASGDRLYALFVLALDTGMRQGELFALEWCDIDFEAGSVQVQRSLEEINGRHRVKEPKSGKGRRIDVSTFALEALQEHRKAMLAEGCYRQDGPVFSAPEGGWLRKPNFQRRVLRPLQKAANLPAIRFHDLRHTAATLMLLNDVNVKVVSERLGHASIQLTLDTYSHVLPTMQQIAAQRMDAFFRRKTGS